MTKLKVICLLFVLVARALCDENENNSNSELDNEEKSVNKDGSYSYSIEFSDDAGGYGYKIGVKDDMMKIGADGSANNKNSFVKMTKRLVTKKKSVHKMVPIMVPDSETALHNGNLPANIQMYRDFVPITEPPIGENMEQSSQQSQTQNNNGNAISSQPSYETNSQYSSYPTTQSITPSDSVNLQSYQVATNQPVYYTGTQTAPQTSVSIPQSYQVPISQSTSYPTSQNAQSEPKSFNVADKQSVTYFIPDSKNNLFTHQQASQGGVQPSSYVVPETKRDVTVSSPTINHQPQNTIGSQLVSYAEPQARSHFASTSLPQSVSPTNMIYNQPETNFVYNQPATYVVQDGRSQFAPMTQHTPYSVAQTSSSLYSSPSSAGSSAQQTYYKSPTPVYTPQASSTLPQPHYQQTLSVTASQKLVPQAAQGSQYLSNSQYVSTPQQESYRTPKSFTFSPSQQLYVNAAGGNNYKGYLPTTATGNIPSSNNLYGGAPVFPGKEYSPSSLNGLNGNSPKSSGGYQTAAGTNGPSTGYINTEQASTLTQGQNYGPKAQSHLSGFKGHDVGGATGNAVINGYSQMIGSNGLSQSYVQNLGYSGVMGSQPSTASSYPGTNYYNPSSFSSSSGYLPGQFTGYNSVSNTAFGAGKATQQGNIGSSSTSNAASYKIGVSNDGNNLQAYKPSSGIGPGSNQGYQFGSNVGNGFNQGYQFGSNFANAGHGYNSNDIAGFINSVNNGYTSSVNNAYNSQIPQAYGSASNVGYGSGNPTHYSESLPGSSAAAINYQGVSNAYKSGAENQYASYPSTHFVPTANSVNNAGNAGKFTTVNGPPATSGFQYANINGKDMFHVTGQHGSVPPTGVTG